jgi:WD40-like Beta Propeller Repeat
MEWRASKQRTHGDWHRTAQNRCSGYTYELSRLSRDCLVRKGALNSETSRALHQTTDILALVSLSLQTIIRSTLLRRASDIIFGLSAACALSLLGGCNTYNPYLGATPTVTSSITSITPSGATAPTNHDVLLTVNGSGFVANSNVTWNSSNSASTNLVSNVVSATQVQANIPASLLSTPGTFFVGVIAPGPASGNNAGNSISNFVPFMVCGSSGCPVVVPTTTAKFSTLQSVNHASGLSAAIQVASRYQAFVASSADGSIDTGTGVARIFLRDSCLGANGACAPQIIPISVGWNGTDPNGSSSSPSVTTDGRFVVFASEANNLVKGDGNGWSDIFLRDTCIAATSVCVPTTIRVSIGPDGAEANGASLAPAISPDGRFVVFNSLGTNLVQPQSLNSLPASATPPLFLRDTCFGAAAGCLPATSRVIPASALQR